LGLPTLQSPNIATIDYPHALIQLVRCEIRKTAWNKAVDEYFGTQRARGAITPLLNIFDYTGRIAFK
jgi:hypothetical protein